eukprot:g6688.t1
MLQNGRFAFANRLIAVPLRAGEKSTSTIHRCMSGPEPHVARVLTLPLTLALRVVAEAILWVTSYFSGFTMRVSVVAPGGRRGLFGIHKKERDYWKKVSVVDPRYPVQIEYRHAPARQDQEGEGDPCKTLVKEEEREECTSSNDENLNCSNSPPSLAPSAADMWSEYQKRHAATKLSQKTALLYVERQPRFVGSKQGNQSLHVLQKIVRGSSLWDLVSDILYQTIIGGTGHNGSSARAFFKFLEDYRSMAPTLDYLFDNSSTIYGRGVTHKAAAIVYQDMAELARRKAAKLRGEEHQQHDEPGALDYVETPLEYYQLLKPHLKQIVAASDVQTLFRICRLHALDISPPSSNRGSNPAARNKLLGLFDITAFVPHVDHEPTCFFSLFGEELRLYSYDNGSPDWKKVTVNKLNLENAILAPKKRAFVKKEMGDLEVFESGSKKVVLESSQRLLAQLQDGASNDGTRTPTSDAEHADDENMPTCSTRRAELTEVEEQRFLFAYRDNQFWDSFAEVEAAYRECVFPALRKRFPGGTEQLGGLYEYLAEVLETSDLKLARQYAKLAFVERFVYFGPDHAFTKRAGMRQRRLLKLKGEVVVVEDGGGAGDKKPVDDEVVGEGEQKEKAAEVLVSGAKCPNHSKANARSRGGRKLLLENGEEIELEYGVQEYNEVADEMIRAAGGAGGPSSPSPSDTSDSASGAGGKKSKSSHKQLHKKRSHKYLLDDSDRLKIRETKEHLVSELKSLGDLVSTLNSEKRKLTDLAEKMGRVLPGNNGASASPAQSSISTRASPPSRGPLSGGGAGGGLSGSGGKSKITFTELD